MNKIDGTDGDDVIVGTAEADNIQGGAGKDRINGGDGNDIVAGGAGNDYVYGDGGDDEVYGGDGNDALVGHSGNDLIMGGNGDDGVFGGGNNDTIYGEAGTDTLFGDGGDDFIDGGEGNDRLFGGSGNDTLVYKAGEGVDEINGNTGIDTVRIEMTSADLDTAHADLADFAEWLENEIESAGGEAAHAGINSGNAFSFGSLGLTVSSIERLELVVDGETVAIEDVLNSDPVAAATQSVDVVEDRSVEGCVNATDPDGDTLNCVISEGPVNGTCVLDPVTGDFTYTPNGNFSGTDSFKVLIEDGNGGSFEQLVNVDVDAIADSPKLSASVGEVKGSVLDGTSGSDNIVGTAGDDVIDGGAGNDTIYGDGGKGSGVAVALDIDASLTDTDGSETLSVTIDGVPRDASLSSGTDLGGGSWQLTAKDLDGLTMTLAEPQDVKLTVTATATEPNGSSNSVQQQLYVEAATLGGDDVIAGGEGNDTIYGGAGDDVVDYSGSDSGVYVNLGAGFGVGEGYDSLDSIEGVIGSDSGDLIVGSNGDNYLSGGAGGDSIYALGGDDVIEGGAGGDSIYGYDGNDVIEGGEGNDYIDGGSGNDTIEFDTAGSGVTVDLGKGRATGDSTGRDSFTSIENVTGSDFADEITGNSIANVLAGGDGDDVLRGHRGADVLSGGAGSDTFEYRKSDVVSGRNHYGVDVITDFGADDKLDFKDLLKGVRYDSIDEVVHATETADGTLLSVDIKGYSGFADVVFLEGVFDLDLDYLDGSGQLIV